MRKHGILKQHDAFGESHQFSLARVGFGKKTEIDEGQIMKGLDTKILYKQ